MVDFSAVAVHPYLMACCGMSWTVLIADLALIYHKTLSFPVSIQESLQTSIHTVDMGMIMLWLCEMYGTDLL